jgi:uncharacterized protein (DUF1499 family)
MWTKILGVVLVFLILPAAAGAIAIAMNRPMLSEPPGFTKRVSVYLRYNAAETTDDPLLPELRLRHYRVPEETMKKAVESSIRSLPRWKIVREEEEVGAYQARVTSLIWRFRDDVSILVTESGPGEVELYVHSASRFGLGDFGANRVHILEFYEAIDRQLKENS